MSAFLVSIARFVSLRAYWIRKTNIWIWWTKSAGKTEIFRSMKFMKCFASLTFLALLLFMAICLTFLTESSAKYFETAHLLVQRVIDSSENVHSGPFHSSLSPFHSALKIGILVSVSQKKRTPIYPGLATLRCYALRHGYHFRLIDPINDSR